MEGLKKLTEDEFPTNVTCTPFTQIEKHGKELKGRNIKHAYLCNVNSFIIK